MTAKNGKIVSQETRDKSGRHINTVQNLTFTAVEGDWPHSCVIPGTDTKTCLMCALNEALGNGKEEEAAKLVKELTKIVLRRDCKKLSGPQIQG